MKKVSLLQLFVLVRAFLVAQKPAASPKNPCEEKPTSQLQMDQCADFDYKHADVRLNNVYRKVLRYMTDDLTRARQQADQDQIKYEETAIASLKQAERAWLQYRDIQCKAAAQQYEGGSMSPMAYSQCLSSLTQHRTEDLKSILRRR